MRDLIKRALGVREAGVLLGLILIAVVFGLCTDTFFSSRNLVNVLRQSAILGIMAMAINFLMISGEFDLSIGSTFALSGIVAVVLMEAGLPPLVSFPLSLLAASCVGLINGLLVTKTKIPSFICTMASMMMVRSVVLMISGARPRILGERGVIAWIFGGGDLFGVIPMPIIWLLLVVALSWMVLSKTPFGYKVFATGDNIQAAQLSGIRTDRIKVMNFVYASLAAGLGGLISLCFLRMVSPTQGSGYELKAIASCVIGGTALSGGIGSVFGAFLGSSTLAVIENGLVLMRTSPYIHDLVVGAVVLGAVILNVRITMRRRFLGSSSTANEISGSGASGKHRAGEGQDASGSERDEEP